MKDINNNKEAGFSAESNTEIVEVDRLAPARICSLAALAVLATSTAVLERTMVMSPLVRLFIIATLISIAFAIFIGGAGRLRIQPVLIYPIIFIGLLGILWSAISNKTPDIISLRNKYEFRLLSHVDEPYLKDGETRNGLDEAGLARSAFWQAMFVSGLKETNPRMLGIYFWQYWWRDLSVQDILDGKYQYTKIVGKTKSLVGYESFDLEKGDMAISKDAKTLLINLGDCRWITASEKYKRVLIINSNQQNYKKQINMPFTIVRWTLADNTEHL